MHKNSSEELRKQMPLEEHTKRLTRVFSNHFEKMKYIMEFEKLVSNRAYLAINPKFKITPFKVDLNEVCKLNKMKNNSLYTSVENDNFILPQSRFTRTDASGLRHKAFSKIMMTKSSSIRFLEGRKTLPEEININELKELKLEHEQGFSLPRIL